MSDAYESDCFGDWVMAPVQMYAGMLDMWTGMMKSMWMMTPLGFMAGASSCSTSAGSGSKKKIVLKGKDKQTVKAEYQVKNHRFRNVTVKLFTPGELSPKPDTSGSKKAPTIEIKPAELELGPWQTRTVEVEVTMNTSLTKGQEYTIDLEEVLVTNTSQISITRTD